MKNCYNCYYNPEANFCGLDGEFLSKEQMEKGCKCYEQPEIEEENEDDMEEL